MRDGDVVAGRYRLEAPLGRGGSSEVWRALDDESGAAVALKVARARPSTAAPDRLHEEAAILGALDHPGIVRVIDSGTDGAREYLVMELLQGRTLREILRESGPMTDEEVSAMGFALADALAEVHARGLLHCDVKPENIVIVDGLPRLIDFGTAQDLSRTLSPAELREIAGTIAYLAPELLTGELHSAQSDIYSLGVTLYESRAGRLPFSGGGGILAGGESRRAMPLRSTAPGVGSRLESAIMQCMAVDPAWRPHSASDLRDRLLSGEQPTVRLRPQRSTSLARPRRGMPLAAAVAGPSTAGRGASKSQQASRPAFPTFEEWQDMRFPRRKISRRVLVAASALLFTGIIGIAALLTLDGEDGGNVAGRDDPGTNAAALAAETPTATPEMTASPAGTATATRTTEPTATQEAPTGTPSPTATPPPPTATSAPPTPTPGRVRETQAQLDASAGMDTVVRWYDLLVAGRFDDAYALWSDRMKANFPRQGNLDGRWANTTGVSVNNIRVISQSEGVMTVGIDFVETLANGNSRRFVGSWRLVASSNGWLLDQPSF